MKILCPALAAAVLSACVCLPFIAKAQSISVDSFDGALTANEVTTFKSYIKTLQPVVWPNTGDMANEYAQGHSDEAIKAIAVMYEVTADTPILDRMISFCHVLLSQPTHIPPPPYPPLHLSTTPLPPPPTT